MNDVQFFPKLTESKQKELSKLYTRIDFLITTTPVDENPMSNGEANTWDWGLIKVAGKEFPAPYKDVGYNWNNEEIELEPEYSAASNLLIFLEMLYGAEKPEAVMSALTKKCYENDAARRVID